MSTEEELAKYRAIARQMLIDEKGLWKRGTFLFTQDGKLNEHYRGLAFLALELPTAEDALDAFLTRSRIGDAQRPLPARLDQSSCRSGIDWTSDGAQRTCTTLYTCK